MKKILMALMIFHSMASTAQSEIKGRVSDEDKKGLANATISLRSGKKTVSKAADGEGNFLFEKIRAGSYQLLLSATGYDNYELQVKVRENEVTDLGTINMIVNSKDLQTVEVIGRNAKKYNSDYSFSATLTSSLNKDIPQAISTVTKELIADRQAFQLADAVKIVSGVIPTSYYNFYSLRGFSQNEEGQIINGMRTRQYFFLQPLTSNIERVEVIKGNASATFSSADPGGSINIVTKKPLAVNRKELNISVGSFSTMRTTLDFTGPLNKEKTLLYRINAAYQQAMSFRDLVHQKSLLLSPSFSYVPNNRTAVNVEFIFSDVNGKLDRGQPIFGAVAGVTDLGSTPKSLNLCATNDYNKSRIVVVMGNLAHKFNENISFNTSYMKQTWTEDLLEHRTTNTFAVDITNSQIRTLAAMQAVQRQQFWDIDNLNSYVNYEVRTGEVGHKLLLGYDLNRWQKLKGGGQNAARGYLLNNGTATNIFVLANAANYQTITVGGVVMPKPNVSHFDLANPVYTLKNINEYVFAKSSFSPELTTANAIFVQEQLYWKKFILLLSLRNEWFKDVNNFETSNPVTDKNNALLPRLGITYKVNDHLNVYGTYLKGYQPQSNTVTLLSVTAPPGKGFDPLEGELKELGLKASLFNGKLQVNAAIYDINERNLLMSANDPAYPDSLVTRGAEKSRGFEMDVAGFILPEWQVNASYSYIDAKILNDNNPKLIGTRKENTPVHSANLWTRYNFATGNALKDLGIGVGLQYNGSRFPWLTRDFEVPAFTLLDLAIYYNPNKSNLQLALNINNVANTTYWIGAFNYLRLFPGAPRNILFTATYRF